VDREESSFIYWDASAVLSALVKDSHSETALKFARKEGLHLLSTFSYAEGLSVLDRMERERILTEVLARSVLQGLAEGPWRFLNTCPSREKMDSLRGKHPLRGADFWHLALALTLKKDIPELVVLAFDQKLREGAEKDGMAKY
jgi:predicted nucleic acid-binding protein